jgi:RND family efflux transporter MFP subunit
MKPMHIPVMWRASCAGALLALPLAHGADFDCIVEPRQVIELRSPVEGLIERITVDRGDSVTRGQVLVTLDAGVERAAAAIARHRATMDGAIRSGESRVEYSAAKSGRSEELYKQKFVSADAREQAVTERRLAEAEVKEAMDNRKLNELEFQRQNEVLRLKAIRSPFNGVVVERLMHPGEVAEAGVGRKPVLKLAEIDTLFVEVLLPTAAYGKVKVGSQVEVMPNPPVGGHYKATVKVVDRVLDSASETFGVRLELPNQKRQLPGGIRCRARFAQIGAELVARPGGRAPRADEKPGPAPASRDARRP